MAVSGFKGFGWLLAGVIVSPGLYLVSSAVAAERGRLEAVDRAIVLAQRDIRGLETEFGTRANFAQLERWNGDVLALSSPRPEQYATGEAALASLDTFDATRDGARSAVMLVPSAPAMVAAVVPAALGETAAPSTPALPAAAATAKLESPPAVTVAANQVRRAVASGKAQAVAMLDRKLLDDGTMGDLLSGARAERVHLR